MLDNRNGLGVRVLHFPNRGALNSILGIGNGMLQGGRGMAQGLHAHFHPGFIHHQEHDSHPFPFLAQQLTDTLPFVAKVQRAGGRTSDAHFMFDISGVDIVEFS